MSDAYEGKCRHCGKCCSTAPVKIADEVIRMNRKCPYLGNDSLCSVYEDRFKAAGWCTPVRLMKMCGDRFLPEGCGYRDD